MAKDYKKRVVPSDKVQVNFNLKREILRKIKYLSYTLDVSHTDIYREAIQQYIEQYEKKNGKIK